MVLRPKATKLLVGIDFGTTFSGVSFAFCVEGEEASEPSVIKRWPSTFSQNYDRQKVPSRINYDEATGVVTWGYNTPADSEPMEWFKLLMLEAEDLPKYMSHSQHIKAARRKLVALKKDAIQVTADYLKQLWDHSLAVIKRTKGASLVDGSQIHVTLTVPAIWKDYARDRMREAIRHAGILDARLAGATSLSLISEPEAAALATLPDLQDRTDLQFGDTFVVCDCGGGTMDVISYRVDQPKPLIVSECVEGNGALCGATFLDQAFENHLKKALGHHTWTRMSVPDVKKALNNEWEHGIKPSFDNGFTTGVIDLPQPGGGIHKVVLKVNDLRKIFNAVIPQIHDLVEHQINAVKEKTNCAPKFIILVGGFGRCAFVYSSLWERFGVVTDVLQGDGEGPWSAVCRGAVLAGSMGFNITNPSVNIRSRVSRLSYGWTFREFFTEGKHDPRDKVFDTLRGRYFAHGQMKWVIKRGQDVDTDNAQSYFYSRDEPLDSAGFKTYENDIYICANANPSARKDNSLTKMASITIRTPVRVETLPTKRDQAGGFRLFSFEYRMKVSGASLEITAWYEGEKIGDTTLVIASD